MTNDSQLRGDSVPVNTKYLHGFSFESDEGRQRCAESHPLWQSFDKVFRQRWDDRKPVLSDDSDRMLFEWFIEGAYQQWRVAE